MTKLTFYTTIKNGLPSQEVLNALKVYEGKSVKLTTQENKDKRSLQQNAYYWGVIVPIMKSAFSEIGYYFDNDKTHQRLKEFISIDAPGLMLEEQTFDKINYTVRSLRSTKEFSKEDFADYITLIQQFAANNFNIYIPDAGEQIEAF